MVDFILLFISGIEEFLCGKSSFVAVGIIINYYHRNWVILVIIRERAFQNLVAKEEGLKEVI